MPLAVLELAKWTQHYPACARAKTTALRCTCGLNEAWQAVEDLLARAPDAAGLQPTRGGDR